MPTAMLMVHPPSPGVAVQQSKPIFTAEVAQVAAAFPISFALHLAGFVGRCF